MRRRRLAAAGALGLPVLALAIAVAVTIARDPGIRLFGSLLLALSLVAAARGLLSGGIQRWVLFAAAALLLVGAGTFLPWETPLLLVLDVVALAALVGAVICARIAFRVRVPLQPVARPARPVLVWNPRSGAGAAVRTGLAEQARARGIEPIELRPGDDLRALVLDAVAAGADAVAAAGGDGTQAVVAEIAAERGLPFACIPAGTRNHVALDLGVDRTDVVG
ncbi:MAG TPA: diacylglycerol kinase family protein, partial [Nannocystaceae bacterium]|nr:diacylglycerol kinase family protein [Nannocystaceae bacterium]